jgi:predicted DsbA family dithiol-disulfide isomerase
VPAALICWSPPTSFARGASLGSAAWIDALFVAYFTEGEDVSDYAVLNRIAGKAGIVGDVVSQLIPLQDEVRELDETARASGLKGVPSYLVDGKLLFSGSQDVDGYVRRLTAAATR